MAKKYIISGVIVLLGLGLTFGALIFVKGAQFAAIRKATEAAPPPTESITSTEAVEKFWRPSLFSVGSLAPVQGVTIEAERSGLVEEIAFENGETVERGQLLVQLDTTVEEAQLKSNRADAELARLTLKRFQNLRQSGAVSQSQLDEAQATFDRAQAAIANTEATIAKKAIRAPFSGMTGIRQVNLGQFLNAGATIVSLQNFDPIFANFSLPQRNLSQLEEGLTVEITTDAAPGQVFRGTVTAINPEVESRTRNVRVQATLENPDRALRPGLFIRVNVLMPEKRRLIAVPASAVLASPYGDSIYFIKPAEAGEGQVARQEFIRTGERRGDFIEIVEGLEVGEIIASSGLFKLRNGINVIINNDLAPEPQEAPTPPNT